MRYPTSHTDACQSSKECLIWCLTTPISSGIATRVFHSPEYLQSSPAWKKNWRPRNTKPTSTEPFGLDHGEGARVCPRQRCSYVAVVQRSHVVACCWRSKGRLGVNRVSCWGCLRGWASRSISSKRTFAAMLCILLGSLPQTVCFAECPSAL